jgi:hypothetical protein
MFIIVGSIGQSINGPNLVVSELINNINILQCATAELNNVSFTPPLKVFIRRLFSSKRHTLPTQKSINENKSIRLGRTFELPNDHMVMVHLYNTHALNFSLYQTCWKNNVRFSVYNSTSTSKNCDSCVLFKGQYQVNCGFIAAINHEPKQGCYVILHTVQIYRHGSLTFKKKNIVNPFIFSGQLTEPAHLIKIHIYDIIVKLAYRKQDIFHFFQFPNTVEST